jgi:hypothetical protein
MTHRLIRYRTRPDQAERNEQLVRAVFDELRSRGAESVRYLVLRGTDGTFFHLVAFEPGMDTSAITTLPAFQEFQRGHRERCLEVPQSIEVTVVGNHRMLPD